MLRTIPLEVDVDVECRAADLRTVLITSHIHITWVVNFVITQEHESFFFVKSSKKQFISSW